MTLKCYQNRMADVKHFLGRKASAMLAGTITAKVLQDILYQQPTRVVMSEEWSNGRFLILFNLWQQCIRVISIQL